jgi:hypothetical protein
MLQEQRNRLKQKVPLRQALPELSFTHEVCWRFQISEIVLNALRAKSHACLEAKPMATGTLQTNDGK